MPTIRVPAVSGSFYPSSKLELELLIKKLLQRANPDINSLHPRAIISPHAGYIYSGEAAASVYSMISNTPFSRVLLLGPTHRVAFNGMALSHADFFNTPLGDIPLDKQTINKLCSMPDFTFNDAAHQHEHSLETQLPFLQSITNKEFSIIPILISDTDYANTANALSNIIDDKNTITVVSSDLSHFHNYDEAVQIDDCTSNKITSLDKSAIVGKEACGCHAINVLLEAARQRNWTAKKIHTNNSGDSSGTKDSVVGYGAYTFE